ncbi:thioesterase II family protein [Streptomyces sp. NPDC002225]|uniref:thioesterase II family protein n=1 Tax=Streptomyces sp. NPDC002225 TaxID=3154413 RepID=UPI00332D9389
MTGAGRGGTAPVGLGFENYLAAPPPDDGRLRLFCFHHAGGGATAYSSWQQELGPDVVVLPVQLPGRETRAREPRITDMAELTGVLDRVLGPALRAPFAFYGHSMGGAVAYNLTLARQRRGASLPERLLVGAFPAPHLPAVLASTEEMSDEEMARVLVGIGGMSEMMLRYPDWLTAATDQVRDDLRVCTSYARTELPLLACPVEVFSGVDDPLLPAGDAEAWESHAPAGYRLHRIPGGHFFFRESPGEFFHALRGAVARMATAPR